MGKIKVNGSGIESISYPELVALRGENKLVPGQMYRIIDYVTTTTQNETKSANHPFDIIVTALNENTLDEKASAIAHEEDTYFNGNDLSAWELWYDLDNDTDKYEWADATNGKGVIYRMIDEKRNDCPYDFKNILFYNDKYTDSTTTDKYYFTFSYVVSGVLYDGTVEKQVVDKCYGNEMGVYITSEKKSLNRNVFRNINFGSFCHGNTFGGSCNNNTFGSSCSNNTFGYDCSNNTFGNYCEKNTFGHYCNSNTFGNTCCSNTFDDYCNSRHIGSSDTSITSNDEYYDDGSGQLVPIKHPDLSTQPSILPYKFMGQYVYEQLIPSSHTYNNQLLLDDHIDTNNLMLLESHAIVFSKEKKCACVVPLKTTFTPDGLYKYILTVETPSASELMYIKIIYTSMPEEDDYYGYNNY